MYFSLPLAPQVLEVKPKVVHCGGTWVEPLTGWRVVVFSVCGVEGEGVGAVVVFVVVVVAIGVVLVSVEAQIEAILIINSNEIQDALIISTQTAHL